MVLDGFHHGEPLVRRNDSGFSCASKVMARGDDPEPPAAVVDRIFLFECDLDPSLALGGTALASALATFLCVPVLIHRHPPSDHFYRVIVRRTNVSASHGGTRPLGTISAMLPAEDALPVELTLGWPEPLPGSEVVLREIGGTLGTIRLDNDEWATLRSSPVYTVRIDDHPATYEWTSYVPDGSKTRHETEISTSPVLIPPNLLVGGELMMWVLETHGAVGRLLWWDDPCTWWIVEEPDLELMLLCAAAGKFRDGSDILSWWEFGTDDARRRVRELCARYEIHPGFL